MDESAPLQPDETVLRRIHRSHCQAGLATQVQRVAFEPRRDENDGISVYRERFVSPAQVAAAGRKPPAEYLVARLNVSDFLDMNLTVVPAPQADLPGHCVITELSWVAFQKDRAFSKRLQAALAALAGKAIVYQPREWP